MEGHGRRNDMVTEHHRSRAAQVRFKEWCSDVSLEKVQKVKLSNWLLVLLSQHERGCMSPWRDMHKVSMHEHKVVSTLKYLVTIRKNVFTPELKRELAYGLKTSGCRVFGLQLHR